MPVLFLAAVIPCLSAVGWETGASAELKSFAALPGDTVIIQNDYGHIRIEPSTGSNVEARIEKRTGSKAATPPTVLADKRGDKIFIYCFFADSPGQSVDIGIRAPKATNILVWGANPGIEISGVEGSVRLQSLTGDTVVEGLTGSVSVMSESGNIAYRSREQPHGDVRLETTSGDVKCELGELLNGRGWFRAGGRVSLGKESQSGQLEQQFGTGGPLIYAGSLAQTKINIDVEAPVSGWSMGWVSGVGVVFAVSAGAFHLLKLGRLLSGRLRDDELVTVQESEDLAQLKTDAGDRP